MLWLSCPHSAGTASRVILTLESVCKAWITSSQLARSYSVFDVPFSTKADCPLSWKPHKDCPTSTPGPPYGECMYLYLCVYVCVLECCSERTVCTHALLSLDALLVVLICSSVKHLVPLALLVLHAPVLHI